MEDNECNRKLISHVLQKAGAEIEMAENGKLGYERAKLSMSEGTPFDVVLMDMHMPVMDGYEATARLKAAGFARPIIATAHSAADDRGKCMDAGCDEFLTKPIDRTMLVEVIRRLSANGVPAE